MALWGGILEFDIIAALPPNPAGIFGDGDGKWQDSAISLKIWNPMNQPAQEPTRGYIIIIAKDFGWAGEYSTHLSL